MHVLHVISGIDRPSGGPASALIGLTQAQAAQGADITVAATWHANNDLSAAEQMSNQGIQVKLIGPSRKPLARHPDIAAILQTLIAKADIIHIHALWEEIQHQAAKIAHRLGVPYIIRPCGMLDPWSLAQNPLKKTLYLTWRLRKNLNRAAAIHFTSNAERDMTTPLDLTPPTIVEPNGVDFAEFHDLPPAGSFRARYQSIADRPWVMFLGRIHPGKGLEYLIPAMAQSSPDDAILFVVGPDSNGYQAAMQGLVTKHRLEHRVVFTGMLQGIDRIAALADADLFALPSDHENFGVVVIEALAAGTPVVISDQVGIHDQITAAGVGAAVPNQIDTLAQELSRWLNDDQMRLTAASKARPFVWKNYNWDNIAQHWLAHYDRLMKPT